MRGALVRVGVDQAFGCWNAPVDPTTFEFVYVPIPDDVPFQPGLRTPFSPLRHTVQRFLDERITDGTKLLPMPVQLTRRSMHLDPDFERLTYGDNGERRGKGIADFVRGDLLVFYAGLRPCRPCDHRLVYAIVGVFKVDQVVRLDQVDKAQWAENAHTRRLEHRAQDVIVRADHRHSGRLRNCIPIGEWRAGAYRVRSDLLHEWGDLSCRDGFIQRSAVPPMLKAPTRFLRWFERQGPSLVRENNPEARE